MPKQAVATQKAVEIKEIKDGVIYLKGGGLRKVLVVSGINFDLKSEDEQRIILGSFQSFINVLDFAVQFFIHSRKINISEYLGKVALRKKEEQNELLRIQTEEYIEFVRSFVEQNPIITKSFFVVVPYDPIAVVEETKKGVMGLFGKKQGAPKQAEGQAKNIEQINYRVDEVSSGLEQIGLRVSQLHDEELTELFYNLYNPELIERTSEEIPKTA